MEWHSVASGWGMVRLFVGLDFPETVRMRLASLAGGVPGARWVPAESMHLTLRFIGEVPDSHLDDIDMALSRITAPRLDLTLDGVGQFGMGAKARVLWAGVERSDNLAFLQSKVESALVRAGLGAEDRKFAPHVTLARLKDAPQHRVIRFLQDNALFRAGPLRIDHFVLFQSFLGREGSVYRPLREYPLGTAFEDTDGDDHDIGEL